MEAAAQAAWPYALLCAWTYLHDHEAADDLMDHAVQNAVDYLGRHPDALQDKLTARVKSVLRRRAKQLAAKRSRELSHGSLTDLEPMYAERTEIEQRVYARELLAQLLQFCLRRQCVAMNGVMRDCERIGVRIGQYVFNEQLRCLQVALQFGELDRRGRYVHRR